MRRILRLVLASLLTSLIVSGCRMAEGEGPRLLQDDIEMRVVASDPDIVTPIGLAIDSEDRLYVLESHTHSPPSDYEGLDTDHIKILSDEDDDGHLDVVGIYAEGFEDGMNLAFSPDGVLHVVTSRAVFALYDRDGDGVSDDRTRLLQMDPPESVYDHAGLLGIAFSVDGWMYVSRGNVGGYHWRITGTDGSSVEGYGDGGNIVRARVDGSEIEIFATGFWNPFDLFFDRHGRLLATDNDPDSRGPNRLLHIIQGGDYGYESLYGGRGIHPYLAWNGELPGTLPYAAGLGEAPTGCIEADVFGYEDAFVCGIWEESALVRVDLSPRGTSIQGTVHPFFQGETGFRPIAMAAASDGSVYLTDWVVRTYPNHGRGRIWRLQSTSISEVRKDPPLVSPLDSIYALSDPRDAPPLRDALISDDPFLRAAAVAVLARPAFRDHVVDGTADSSEAVRLGALLALQRAGHEPAESVARRLLDDPDAEVRRMALIWIGKAGMTSLRPDLERHVNGGRLSPEHFETYLATMRHLDPTFIQAYRSRAAKSSNQLERSLPEGFIATFAADTSRPDELRAAAVAHLDDPGSHYDLLAALARAESLVLRLNAVRALAGTVHPDRAALLLDLAENVAHPSALRAEALLALHGTGVPADRVAKLLDDSDPDVRLEAARYLRNVSLSDSMRSALAKIRADGRVAEQLAFVLSDDAGGRTARTEDGLNAAGGDPSIGRRVFFWPKAQCASCHSVDQFGGDVGPDLSNIGASKSREQLVRALIDPSAEVAPDWQGWYVKTSDGQTRFGRQIDVGNDDVEIYTLDGRFVRFDDAVAWGVADRSLMPEGLETVLSASDFRDLIAFLEHQK